MAQTIFDTPIGPLYIDASSKGLRLLSFLTGYKHEGLVAGLPDGGVPLTGGDEIIEETKRQLDEYFHDNRRKFDLPLDIKGSAFRQRVWQVIASIPFGETYSYAEVAIEAGAPGAYRAAGSACGANPIVIIVPCHRVVGSDKALHGFGGGLGTKVALLRHEGSLAAIKGSAIATAGQQPALV
jgi:O-6-methylguanine DNA methyltransferase